MGVESGRDQSERLKAALVDGALDCMVAVDERGRVVEFNQAAERTFGYTADEAIGSELGDLIAPPDLRDEYRWELGAASGEDVEGDLRTELVAMRKVRDRIDREYARPLDVEALARGVHMSAGHLSRQFREAYGESPYSYLMTRRIERAMTLLRHGDLTVTEVCFAVGFSSLGTFSTRFTELVGVPPSVYRQQAAEVVESVAGIPSCVVKQDTRPIRNQEARMGPGS